MAVFHIMSFVVLILYIAYRSRETLSDVIPMAACVFVLLLYGLAFFNGLGLADYLAVLFCALAALYYVTRTKEEKKKLLCFCLEELKKPGSIIALLLMILVPVLTGGKAVTWWDDYNFWATDVKSIFYLNGFAQKYQNVASEFGDYPPGTQMMKWWFLHMHPSEFKEGLLFAGYYFFNLTFLFPLLTHLKKRNPLLMILTGLSLWLFPSCVEAFGYDGCCADLTMAVIYGAFLAAVADKEGHTPFFYYGRQALYLMVLVLCKNMGFMWFFFALVFLYGYHAFVWKTFPFCRRKRKQENEASKLKEQKQKQEKEKEQEKEQERRMNRKGILAVTLLPMISGGIWLLFCLWNRRIAKLTGAAIHMAAGSMKVPEVKGEIISAYLTAFLRYPLHRYSTFSLDLSPFALYLLLLVFVFLLYKRGRAEKRQAVYIGSFLAVSGICFYGINILSHLTLFATEMQYLEPFAMVSSIERYGAPFTIGGLYLIAYLTMSREAAGSGKPVLENQEAAGNVKPALKNQEVAGSVKPALEKQEVARSVKPALENQEVARSGKPALSNQNEKKKESLLRQYGGLLACLFFVFLTADYGSAYRGLIGYRNNISEEMEVRKSLIDENALAFLNEVLAKKPFAHGRVLYLRDISDVSWVRNTYLNFEASPISVMYGNIDASAVNAEDILNAIGEAHAGYLYADEIKGGEELFAPLTEDGAFDYGCLYRMDTEKRKLILVGEGNSK